MGSSAASAAAAAWAVNGLFGCPVSKDDLVLAGLASEAAVSGYHADNVGPALLGGFVLVRSGEGRSRGAASGGNRPGGQAQQRALPPGNGMLRGAPGRTLPAPAAPSAPFPPLGPSPRGHARSCDPLELFRLPYGAAAPPGSPAPPALHFALVNPLFEAPTKQMRAALPQDVPFRSMVHNCTQGGALVAAILQGAPEGWRGARGCARRTSPTQVGGCQSTGLHA